MKILDRSNITIICGILMLLFLFSGIHTFHNHYLDRLDHAKKARIYLTTDVCQDHKKRVELGDWQKCTESEHELRIPAYIHSLYDTLQDYHLCGHNRCYALGQWFVHHKWLFIILLVIALYFFSQVILYNWQVEKLISHRNNVLPGYQISNFQNHAHLD